MVSSDLSKGYVIVLLDVLQNKFLYDAIERIVLIDALKPPPCYLGNRLIPLVLNHVSPRSKAYSAP